MQTSRLSCKGMSDLIKNINHQETTLNEDDSSTTVESMEEEATSATPNASEGSTILTTEPRHVETSTPTKSELTPSPAQEHTTMGTTIAAVTVTPGREKSAVINRYYYRHYSFSLACIIFVQLVGFTEGSMEGDDRLRESEQEWRRSNRAPPPRLTPV